MHISGICFTGNGRSLAEKIDKALHHLHMDQKLEVTWYVNEKNFSTVDGEKTIFEKTDIPVREWAGERFADSDAIIFIGAAGIAVRAVAPHVLDKRSDPAVIVLDEKGQFCISLLSGHIGGANMLVTSLSEEIGSTPVITTATDVNHLFAVDVFATKNKMTISNMTYAKEVSAALLAGEPVGFWTGFTVSGELPGGVFWSDKLVQAREDRAEGALDGTTLGIVISPSYSRAYFHHTLWLIPRCLVLGIGCKRGTKEEDIRKAVRKILNDNSLYAEAVAGIATIDLKKDEPGLLSFCRRENLPLYAYSAEELQAVEGTFSASSFVEKTTGVDNVCERSAVKAGGNLLVKKTAENGVTCAVALIPQTISF